MKTIVCTLLVAALQVGCDDRDGAESTKEHPAIAQLSRTETKVKALESLNRSYQQDSQIKDSEIAFLRKQVEELRAERQGSLDRRREEVLRDTEAVLRKLNPKTP